MKPASPNSSNVAQLDGWILIAPTVNQDGKRDGGWYVASRGLFTTKKRAMSARHFTTGERAIRGKIVASQDPQ